MYTSLKEHHFNGASVHIWENYWHLRKLLLGITNSMPYAVSMQHKDNTAKVILDGFETKHVTGVNSLSDELET